MVSILCSVNLYGRLMAPSLLATCVEHARSLGWNAGLMGWKHGPVGLPTELLLYDRLCLSVVELMTVCSELHGDSVGLGRDE